MWKLTIIQKKKSNYGNYTNSQEIELKNENIQNLLLLIDKIRDCEGDIVTEYSVERIREKEEGEVE